MQITDFIEFSAFFNAYMRKQRAEGSRISYRFLVKELGLHSTSSLAMIASGKRLPTEELLEPLCRKLRLNDQQIAYARFMIQYARAKTPGERQYFWEKMNRLRPQTEQQHVDLDSLELISQWEYLVLICLAGEERGIDSNLEKLAADFKHRMSVPQLEDKLQKLVDLGFIVKNEEAKYFSHTGKMLTTPPGISSTIVKNMHQQMLQIAREEVYQQDVDERYFTSMFLTMNPRKLERAKELMSAFRKEFDRDIAEEDPLAPTEVYQLGIQFFKMTDRIRSEGDPF